MAEILLGGKKLPELKVTELKAELDKRGLLKKGVKSLLIERLRKAILEELNSVEPVDVDDSEETDDSHLDVDTSHLDTSQMEEEQGAFTTDIVGDLLGRADSQTSEDNAPLDDQAGMTGDLAEALPLEEVKVEETEEDEGRALEEDKTDTDKLIVEDEDGDVEVLRLEYEGTPEEMEDPVAPEQEDIAKTEEERAEDDVVPHEGTPVMDEDPKDIVGKLMELTSPLNSSSEKMEDEERTSKEEEDGAKTDEVTVAEAKDEGRSIGRLDSEMESSYSLDAEVLLYEGDVENEPEQSFDKKDDYLLDDEGNEYGLIVNLHDDSMDIDVAPKVQPKAGVKKGSLPEARSRKDQLQQSGGDTRRKQPPDAAEPPRSPLCHLWVCGLVSTVRALDLQTLFSPFGQVVSAKVVAKARSKKNRFGYVTMATPEQAQRCIKELSGMELKGNKITVEVAKSQPAITRPSDNKDKEHEAARHAPTSSSRKPSEKDQASAVSGETKREERDSKSTATERGGSGGKSSDKPRRTTQTDKSQEESGQRRDDHSSGRGSGRGRRSLPGRRSRSRSPERTRLMRRSSPGSQRSLGSGRNPNRGRRRSRSPPRGRGSHGGGSMPLRGDARHEIMRREAERREMERREMERRMGDPYLRERERQVEARLEERRIAHSRHQEMLMRRQLEMEHTRREQEMAIRVQESRDREARERELRERQLAEQERLFKERERELREREYRERQRREVLERELREREGRERELRERERRLREQHERETREREMKAQREQEIRVKIHNVQAEKEKELRERERKLREEHEQIERERLLYEEQHRRIQEEQERRAKEREELERRERERRLREEKDRERQERERRERERIEEERAKREKREREELMLQQQRLGKRPYGGDSVSYESVKRQAVHDVRSGSDNSSFSSPSSVFGRLDPPTQNRSADVPPLLSRAEDVYRRGESERSRPPGASGFRSGGGQSRDRHSEAVTYPVPVASTSRSMPTSRSMQVMSSHAIPVAHQTGNIYGKTMMGSLGGGSVQEAMKPRSGTSAASLSRVPPDIITAATQALENIRKTVATAGQVPGSRVSPQVRIGHAQTPTAVQLQQLAASARSAGNLPGFLSLNPRSLMGTGLPPTRQPVMSSPGGGGVTMVTGKPQHQHKLPPEDERYNRRLSRPQGQTHQVRPSAYKRLI